MRYRLHVLVLGLLSEAAAAAEGQPFQRLGDAVVPTFQQIELKLDPRQEAFSGSTVIELRATEPVDTFALHARELDLETVRLTGRDTDLASVPFAADEVGRVDFKLPRALVPGDYTLAIEFSGNYNRNSVGLYKTEVGADAYLYTQFEMQDARRAFPIFDEPVFKIPYRMTLSVPERMTAVSNTPVEAIELVENRRIYRFAKTKPLSSYHLAIAVGEFDSIEIEGLDLPARIYTVQGQAHLAKTAAAYTPKILAALERYFDRPYPYAKLDFLALPEFPFGAMENVGAVTYRDDILLIDLATAGPTDLERMAGVIAHELAHMWYGNLVTMEWWNDLWLNEAFASWMADKIVIREFPEFRAHLDLPQNRAMVSDARPSTLPIRRPVTSEADILDGLGLAYSKGKTLLDMVERWIGEVAFQEAMWDYLAAHEFGNARANDLWGALAETSGMDVRSVLSSYLDQSGFPIIEAAMEGEQLVLQQRRFLNAGVEAENRLWTTPISLKYSRGGEIKSREVVLGAPGMEVEIGPDVEWLYPDAEARGYYRWNLPAEHLKRLAENAGAVLSDRERIGLLANLSALLDAGAISGGDFLAAVAGLASDPVPEVVDAVIGQLDKVREQMLREADRPAFRAFVREALEPTLGRVGLEPRPGEPPEVTKLRPELIRWVGGVAGDASVIGHAQAFAREYFESGLQTDPRLAGALLRVAAGIGDETLFEQVRIGYENSALPDERSQLLATLGSFRDPALREKALDYTLTDAVTPPDMLLVYVYAREDPAATEQVLAWTMDRYPQLAAKAPPFRVPQIPRYLPTDCQPENLERIKTFFSRDSRKVEGTERSLLHLEDAVMDCHRLRERTAADVARFLRSRQG